MSYQRSALNKVDDWAPDQFFTSVSFAIKTPHYDTIDFNGIFSQYYLLTNCKLVLYGKAVVGSDYSANTE